MDLKPFVSLTNLYIYLMQIKVCYYDTQPFSIKTRPHACVS